MNILKIPKLYFKNHTPDLDELSIELDSFGVGERIDLINWEEFSYKPEVKFNIAYNDNELFLKYYVREKYIAAEKTNNNDMVCEDSCVEFFVSPPGKDYYFNFEFNCIGTCLLGKGYSRINNKVVNPELINRIRRLSSLGNKPFGSKKGDFVWTMIIAIPLDLFLGSDINDLKNKRFKANFYKCGDKLEEIHYLTWNKVNTKNPDYHQPEFFGDLVFD